MIRSFVIIIFFVTALCAAGSGLGARELRVGVVGSAPFVTSGRTPGMPARTRAPADGFGGISVELWEEVAYRMGVRFQLKRLRSVEDAIRAVERNEIDLAVGNISITASRSQRVDYTQPYFQSGIGMLTRKESAGLWATIKPFLRLAFFIGVGTLLTVLFIVGNFFYFAERRADTIFKNCGYLAGVGHGMWFALVTFTTVGYGDIAPATRAGRVIAGIWMVVALITASSLTASIATSFTLLQLRHVAVESPEALEGEKVAVVRGTTGEQFAERFKARRVYARDIEEAIDMLAKEKVLAVGFDYPVLRYYLHNNPNDELHVLESRQSVENYGFVGRRNDDLVRQVNRALLETLEAGELSTILMEWEMN